jgi:hypothetical protein
MRLVAAHARDHAPSSSPSLALVAIASFAGHPARKSLATKCPGTR